VISGTTASLEEVYGLSSTSLGFTVAIALIGTIVGSITASRPADRFGRRPALVITAALYLVSAIGSALAPTWVLFLIARFVGGIGVGAASVVSPMFTAEISPAEHRRRLVALVQFNIVLGILLAFASNYVLAQVFSDNVAWRWMFGVEAVPAAAFLLLLGTVRETPRWLLEEGRTDAARDILHTLGLPLRDGVADLAIAFMSFQDVDDLHGAVRGAAAWLGRSRAPAVLHLGAVPPASARARPRRVRSGCFDRCGAMGRGAP